MPEPDNRVTITAKLTPGVDDDLINEWNKIENGKRQAVLKSALREVLLNKPPAEQYTGASNPDELVNGVNQMLDMQKFYAEQQRAATENLREALAEVWSEHARMISADLPNFIERTIHQATANMKLATSDTASDNGAIVDDQPRISEEEKLERKANLRKTKW